MQVIWLAMVYCLNVEMRDSYLRGVFCRAAVGGAGGGAAGAGGGATQVITHQKHMSIIPLHGRL